MDSVNILINYIKDKYINLEEKCINGNSSVFRYTKPSMSTYVENAVALFLSDILKKKKYHYLIDPQLSIGKRQPKRPDIIVYDDNNVIHAIIEVKSQLGFSGGFKTSDYNNKIKSIKSASKKSKLYLKKFDTYFKVSDDCIDFVFILMLSNDHQGLKKFKYVNHYVLFNSRKVWYDDLSIDDVNHGSNGIEELIKLLNSRL